MDTSKCAEKLLVALVREFELNPAELNEPGFGLDGWDLAWKAGVILKKEADLRRQNISCGAMDDLAVAFSVITTRDWAKASDVGAHGKYSPALWPTPKGIDHAHELMRPWYRKALDAFAGDARTIVVAVVTALIISVITNLIIS